MRRDLPSGLPPIEADVTQIRQVIMNLVINAAEAIGDRQGVITLRTGSVSSKARHAPTISFGEPLPTGTFVWAEIQDTGCGMDDRTRKEIFEPFYTTKPDGRGLGLSAVLGIVRGHHGAIHVDSASGRGTTIRVAFPASELGVTPKSAAEECAITTCGSKTGRVLVVDDEEVVRSFATKTLRKAGFTVLAARDGHEALKLFRRHQDDIIAVLLDLRMPRLDGAEVLRELRRLRPDLPVVLSSGYSEQEALNEFARQGPAAFLQKPYHAQSLVNEMSQVINSGS